MGGGALMLWQGEGGDWGGCCVDAVAEGVGVMGVWIGSSAGCAQELMSQLCVNSRPSSSRSVTHKSRLYVLCVPPRPPHQTASEAPPPIPHLDRVEVAPRRGAESQHPAGYLVALQIRQDFDVRIVWGWGAVGGWARLV